MTEPTLLVAKLCREFKIDYHKVMTHYDVEAKIDLTDALLKMVTLIIKPEHENYLQEFNQLKAGLLRKYRSRLKPFIHARLYTYFNPSYALEDRNNITEEELEEGLTDYQYNSFLQLISTVLRGGYQMFNLESAPNGVAEAGKLLPPMEWLGTQKELAEWIVESQKKGWLGKVNSRQIQQAFTKTATIGQLLKPAVDRKTLESTYDQIYTVQYKPKFDTIRQNPKQLNFNTLTSPNSLR